jgi:hypothetical protein
LYNNDANASRRVASLHRAPFVRPSVHALDSSRAREGERVVVLLLLCVLDDARVRRPGKSARFGA